MVALIYLITSGDNHLIQGESELSNEKQRTLVTVLSRYRYLMTTW